MIDRNYIPLKERKRLARLERSLAGVMSHSLPSIPQREGYLVVTCWCEAKFVYVTKDNVAAGRTRSCGEDCCSPELQPTTCGEGQ